MKKLQKKRMENGSILVQSANSYAIVTKNAISGPFEVGRIGGSFTVSTSEQSITLRDLRKIQLELKTEVKRGLFKWLA